MRYLTLILLLLLFSLPVAAQNDKEKARELGGKGIDLTDAGKYEEAIGLFRQAEQLDPSTSVYAYEKGLAFYRDGQYDSAKAVYERIINRSDADDTYYQMLGNVYDLRGQRQEALATYARGLKKFPNSGKLYLETGNIYFAREEYDKAIGQYENGIRHEPAFPSNYFRATQLFLSSDEKVWGMLYGELFMNLERGSDRTRDVSKWLFDTYRKQITWNSDTSMSISFSKNNVIDVDKMDKHKMRLPFGVGVYEPVMLLAALSAGKMDLEGMCRMRTSFLKTYYEQKHDQDFPNLLFSYQNRLEKAGYLDAYNHWILSQGDPEAFKSWVAAHAKDWDAFIEWFKENPLEVTDKNVFVRGDYL